MTEFTEKLNLKKPAPTDFYAVEDFNENADIIDRAFKQMESFKLEHTIPANAWNNGAYILTSDKITSASQDIELLPGSDMTKEQYMAAQMANIISLTQDVGSITLECLGTVPTIDLPVSFVMRGGDINVD